ncbi:RNA pyrophosphohydrolase [Pseudovibrio axinellae]|uniref:RNA pyrophosphohydrolase n=1 Tax=Pseudovibrio axinellae TaxID=989403 RepID=A0A165YH05_9HYPH|nr:NUDIX domain-containing protein [Pseudovibrio axinellae]KZL18836.1 RNA pyrophosphohydrolase [Pseudovibrio axinellae]SEP90998.1 ADP-ribose pyrophosphatase YjhB, NUDIX family [Pseudovibrio axinellae]
MSKENAPTYIEAASVACVHNNQVLLIKRGLPPGEGLWAFPGGKVMPLESPEQAARRELLEETTLYAQDLKSWTVSYPSPEDCDVQYRIHVFTCNLMVGREEAASDAAELGWYSLEASMGLPLAPGMQQHLLNLFR